MLCGEIIAIGDELTSGQRLDTNSAWVAERLGDLGVVVKYHTTVGDDLSANVRVFQTAIQRAEVIVVTGGLGPTADDLTRQALADAVGVPLEQNTAAPAHIEQMFAKRNRPMPPANVVQSFFPEGSCVVANPHGTAPGIDLTVERKNSSPARIFCLPGVPAEMREMWEQTVKPAIAAMQPTPCEIHHLRIKTFGVGESDLEAMLPDLIRRGREPSVGITVSQATITLRISASGKDRAACLEKMRPTYDTIHQCLGDLIFGYEDDELQHAVIKQLNLRSKTLATLEFGTGGLVANWLSEALGDKLVYRGGEIIGPRADVTPLTETMLRHLARIAKDKFSADILLAIGPFPGQPLYASTATASPAAVLLYALHENGETAMNTPYSGHPDILKARVAKSGLNLIRKLLL